MNVDVDAIPDDLKERDQWLLWDNSPDTPKQPHWRGDFGISWSDPDDWHSFEEAIEAARERDRWGIGYVMAKDNPQHARGLYGCIDIDGGLTDDGDLKDWVPSLDRFTDGFAYIEKSPSGTGLHIPFVGHDVPDWWSDSQLDDHEGVDVLTNKFCTFTGAAIDASGSNVTEIDPTEWLFDAYESINGEAPRLSGQEDGSESYDDDYLDDEDIEEALNAISQPVEYPKWRNIGFALHSWYDGSQRGKRIFTNWSKQSAKWDDQSQRYIDAIWQSASATGNVTIGTLVHHAKQDNWTPPSPGGEQPPALDEADDDWTLAETIQRLVLDAVDPDDDSNRQPITQDEAVDRTASILCDHYDFLRPRDDTRGWRDTLYVYSDEDGIYEPHGETHLESEVERLLGDFATNQRVREVIGKIERRSRVNKRRLTNDPHRLVVANGILDLTTGTLDDHTPDEYHKTMIDVEWQPDAECPAIDDFFHDVVDSSDVPKLYRLVAHCLYKDYAAEKAAMLLGDGRNGKSVFLSVVEQFLGQWNVSNQSLQELNEDEWAANNLVGKLANVHPDMSDQTVETMQMFKKLTGRDTVSANVKFEEPIRFENHATLLFACNRMPVLKDDTRGNWRRWILIDFPNTFEPGAEETEPKQAIMDRVTRSEEFQGLLVRCVEEIKAWDNGRAWFPTAPSWENARKRIRRAAEPVYDFAHACLEDDEGYETTDAVRRAYQQYASSEGLPPISREAFGKKLLNQTDYTIEKNQRRIDGKRRQVYEGVVFTSRGSQLANGSGSDDQDDRQDSLGGPQGRTDKVCELTREHADSDGVPHDMLVGLAVAEGFTREQADDAIDHALTQGELMAPSDAEVYFPT